MILKGPGCRPEGQLDSMREILDLAMEMLQEQGGVFCYLCGQALC